MQSGNAAEAAQLYRHMLEENPGQRSDCLQSGALAMEATNDIQRC